MGATASLSFVEATANEDTVTHAISHSASGFRFYAHIAPRLTILTGWTGTARIGVLSAETQLWFREGQFQFTYYKGVV